MHLGIHPGAGKQALTQLWIKILRPVRQCCHCRAVAPGVKRRNNAATGPGRLLPQLTAITQHHLLDVGRQVERRQQADHSAADYHYLLGHLSIQRLK
ncbi:hypothetical protein D3C76_1024980 [compost metagenome]